MRDLIANLALRVYFILMKGEQEMMAMLFACRVVEGRTEFDRVPAKLKKQVADIIINDFNLPEIIPVEYGGTLSSEA
jgi:hypothetical protein